MSKVVALDSRVKSCCGASTVVDSREMMVKSLGLKDAVYRRRECNVCGARWTTVEVSSSLISELTDCKMELEHISELRLKLAELQKLMGVRQL